MNKLAAILGTYIALSPHSIHTLASQNQYAVQNQESLDKQIKALTTKVIELMNKAHIDSFQALSKTEFFFVDIYLDSSNKLSNLAITSLKQTLPGDTVSLYRGPFKLPEKDGVGGKIQLWTLLGRYNTNADGLLNEAQFGPRLTYVPNEESTLFVYHDGPQEIRTMPYDKREFIKNNYIGCLERVIEQLKTNLPK